MSHLLASTFEPAVESPPRASAAALAALRVLAGLLWLYNVSWKRPPDFGEDSGTGLYGFTQLAVENPVFPPYSWVVENVVLPNFLAFGWMVLVVETLLAVLLRAVGGRHSRGVAVGLLDDDRHPCRSALHLRRSGRRCRRGSC